MRNAGAVGSQAAKLRDLAMLKQERIGRLKAPRLLSRESGTLQALSASDILSEAPALLRERECLEGFRIASCVAQDAEVQKSKALLLELEEALSACISLCDAVRVMQGGTGRSRGGTTKGSR